jgi:hypothetical protein
MSFPRQQHRSSPSHLRAWLAASAVCLGAAPGSAQTAISIEKLLEQGWEIAGYVAAWENRSLILFRHKDHKYLVQCSVLIDVLRSPRTVIACYGLR